MTGLAEVAFGLLLGFSLAAPPGPMNALIAARATRSYSAGFLTACGALTADAVLGALVFGLESLVDLRPLIAYVYVSGAVTMSVMGYLLLRERTTPGERPAPKLGTYTQSLGVGLSNPFQIVWWLTAGVAFAYVGGAWLFAGLFGAIAIWIVIFPWAIHRGSRRYPSVRPWIGAAAAALMFGFAIYFAAEATISFRGW